MKKIKTILILLITIVLLPIVVNAGEIRFNYPTKTSANTYEFTLTVDNINLNSISGNIGVTNGTITKITMSNNWLNKTGMNNTFYFYHDGASTGSYTVATIEVTMTGNSEYTINNLKYGLNKCVMEQGNYFGENGNLVSKSTYESTCSKSHDATLKSITVSSGTLSPKFDPSLELYGVTVNNNVSTINFNPVTSNNKAKVISGSTCSLKVGVNLCKIVVQAEAGNQKTYTITVTRKNANNTTLSSDASISNLVVHGGTLTKTFNSNIKEYDVKVSGNIKYIYFTFITNSDKVSHTSGSCNINNATKTCKLTITAEDGVTKNSYLFNIIHDEKTDKNTTSNNNSNNSSHTNPPSSTNKNNTASNNKNNESTNSNSITNEENNNTSIDVDIETNENQNDYIEEIIENNEVESLKEDTIKVPLMSKEVSKDIFLKTVAVMDLLLGIGIGLFIAKHYKVKNSTNNKNTKKRKSTTKK